MGVVGVALLALLAYACLGAQQRGAVASAIRAFLGYLSPAHHATPAPELRSGQSGQRGASGAAQVTGTGRVAVAHSGFTRRRDSTPGAQLEAAPDRHVAAWTCGDVAAWLHSIELGAYADSFKAHSVCGLLLLSLSRDELATLGMVSPLHVKKLQLRLAALEGGEQPPAVAVTSALPSAVPPQLLPRREALLMEAGSATRSEAAATDVASVAPSEADSSCCGLLRGHGGWVTACAWCPGGTLLTGGDDGAVRVWDRPDAALAPPTPVALLEGHAGAVRAAVPLRSHGGDSSEIRCGTVGDDGTLRLWVITPTAEPPVRCEAVVAAHSDAVFGLLALPSGGGDGSEELVTCSADATARVWAVSSRGSVTPGPVLAGHTDYVLAACHLAPEGDDMSPALVKSGAPHLLVTASWDATLRVWELPPGVCEASTPPPCARILRGHRGGVRCVVALPRLRCCSAGADGTLRVWQAATGAAERVLRLPRGPTPGPSPGAVLALAALPGGTGVACAREDGVVRLWRVAAASDAGLRHSLEGHGKRVYCLAVRSHGEVVLASGSRDRTVRLWRVAPSWT